MTLELIANRWAEMRATEQSLRERANAGDHVAQDAYREFCIDIDQRATALEIELEDAKQAIFNLESWVANVSIKGDGFRRDWEDVSRYVSNLGAVIHLTATVVEPPTEDRPATVEFSNGTRLELPHNVPISADC